MNLYWHLEPTVGHLHTEKVKLSELPLCIRCYHLFEADSKYFCGIHGYNVYSKRKNRLYNGFLMNCPSFKASEDYFEFLVHLKEIREEKGGFEKVEGILL